MTGVYCILNIATGKRYVGSSATSIRIRWREHRNTLKRGVHRNPLLQNAWNKYGEHNFTFSVVVACGPDECIAEEQAWIDSYNAANRKYGYNIAPKAGSTRGRPVPDHIRKQISAKLKGKPLSEETKAKMSAARKGRKLSAETRAKMAAAASCRSEEHKSKLSIWQKGKRKSASHRAALSAAHRGKPLSAEHRARQSAGQLKRWEELKLKRKAAQQK